MITSSVRSWAALSGALTFLFILGVSPNHADAQAPEEEARPEAARDASRTLEFAFDHGIGFWKPAGERWETPNAVGSLDVRLHGSLGLGGMVRVGLVQLGFSRFELETGPTFRGWLLREGPRGLQLGGGLGVSVSVRFDDPRPTFGTDECVPDPDDPSRCRAPYDGRVGAFAMMHLDYREHGFLVGLAVLGRWLPHDLQSSERWSADFAIDLVLRVGGELAF